MADVFIDLNILELGQFQMLPGSVQPTLDRSKGEITFEFAMLEGLVTSGPS